MAQQKNRKSQRQAGWLARWDRWLSVEADVLEPLLHIEAWTCLVDPWQVTVPYDVGIGKICSETLQQFGHRPLLRCGARVGRLAAGVESALVAYAYAVGVVVLGVCSDHLFGPAKVDESVAGDVVVVAYGAETACLVARFKVFHAEAVVCPGGRAMDDDEVDVSHG